ncbi:MAG: phosphocholine cytidylyltransferase family protein [Myxococcota bacterium]
MKAVVLSAGQGRRLLPLTRQIPKCLLSVSATRAEPLLARQLTTLARAGVEHAVVLIGFGAQHVEEWLATHPIPGIHIETRFNPFYEHADNLITCWLARSEFEGPCLLLNGDTLFAPEILRRVLDAPPSDVLMTVDHKHRYDDDDMKVELDARRRVRAVGKALATGRTHAESIGLFRFAEDGPKRFVHCLEEAVRHPAALSSWYLDAVDRLARMLPIETLAVDGAWWREIDDLADLQRARHELSRRPARRPAHSPRPASLAINP